MASTTPSDPHLTRPELSARVVVPLLEALEDRLSVERVDELIRSAGLEPDFVRNPDHWVGSRFLTRLRDAALPLLGVEGGPPGPDHPVWQLWRQAGKASMSRRHLGAVWPIVSALGSPRQAYAGLVQRASLVTRTMRYEVVDQGRGRITLRLHPLIDEAQDGPELCWTQIGALEAVPRIWELPMAQVEHPRCRHRGEDRCDFEIRYRDRRWPGLLLVGAATSLGGLLGVLLATVAGVEPAVGAALGALVGWAAEGWRRALQARATARRDVEDLERMVFAADRRAATLWAEREEQRRLLLAQRNVQAFLPRPVFERLSHQQKLPQPGGAHLDTTVLFSDIQGYSAIAEALSSDQVLALLNAYFDEMAQVVDEYEGTVLEFMGDGLLVVFGAPQARPDHAARAVACAAAMHRRVAELNDGGGDGRITALLAATPWDRLLIRVGMHSGEVLAGNLGAHDQMRYSVIGDVVNVAAHLERLNKQTGTRTLLSGDTRSRLPAAEAAALRGLGPRAVKGRDGQVDLWTPDPHRDPGLLRDEA